MRFNVNCGEDGKSVCFEPAMGVIVNPVEPTGTNIFTLDPLPTPTITFGVGFVSGGVAVVQLGIAAAIDLAEKILSTVQDFERKKGR